MKQLNFTVVMMYTCFIQGTELYINTHDFVLNDDDSWLVQSVFDTIRYSKAEGRILSLDGITIKYLFNGVQYNHKIAKQEHKDIVTLFRQNLSKAIDNHNKPMYDEIERQKQERLKSIEQEEYQLFLKLCEKYKPSDINE